MTHEEALRILGLESGSSAKAIKVAASEKRAEIETKIAEASAGTMVLAFQQVLDNINLAEQTLSQSQTKSNKTKMAGIAVLLVLGISVAVMQFAEQEGKLEKLPEPEVVQMPEPVQVAQEAGDTRATQLQAEIGDLLERLKKIRQQMADNRQTSLHRAQDLTQQLQSPGNDVAALSQALMAAESQAEHWQEVETLADKVVYETTAYAQLPDQISGAEQLMQDNNIQGAVDALMPVKATIVAMLGQAENTEAVVTDGRAVRKVRASWQTLAKQQGWDQIPPALKIEKGYQDSYQDENQGQFKVALAGYSVLLKGYGALQQAGETLLATQPPLATAKDAWLVYAKEHSLTEIAPAKALDQAYQQYQQTITGGELLAASEKAVSLEKDYTDLLNGAMNVSKYRDMAIKAKKDWGVYAGEQKLTAIPQHKLWAKNMAGAETDLKAGNLPQAGMAYKQLAEDYTALLANARLAIELQERARLAQSDWNKFAVEKKLKTSRATAAAADFTATQALMRKGQFEAANKILTT
ncbi:MAG: hypothetical protein OQK69_01430, partial [Gammaproteobacteria bacterium]|nr:hypothetical protein [Gammaproteobacteria bacterium]